MKYKFYHGPHEDWDYDAINDDDAVYRAQRRCYELASCNGGYSTYSVKKNGKLLARFDSKIQVKRTDVQQ